MDFNMDFDMDSNVDSNMDFDLDSNMDSSRQQELCTGPLGKLSVDLVQEITSYLDLTSAVCFSLTCRSLRSIIGTGERGEAYLQPDPGTRRDFLEVLERDFPDHVLCYFCEQLHRIDNLPRGSMFKKRGPQVQFQFKRACRTITTRAGIRKFIHPNFDYSTFQLAMKRYRLGLECAGLFKAIGFPKQYRVGRNDCAESDVEFDGTTLEVELRMTNESLFMRKELTIWREKEGRISPHLLNICAHQHHPFFSDINDSYWRIFGEVYNVPINRCPRCGTEFEMKCAHLNDKEEMVHLITWMELGKGLSPLDDVFYYRLQNMETLWRDTLLPIAIYGVAGTVRALFEQGSPVPGAELQIEPPESEASESPEEAPEVGLS